MCQPQAPINLVRCISVYDLYAGLTCAAHAEAGRFLLPIVAKGVILNAFICKSLLLTRTFNKQEVSTQAFIL